MLHLLIHMEQHGGRATSAIIARMLGTNPVVVRRTMAGLRDHGLVRSAKGHGGGWTLERPLADVSMLDIYQALGEPALFAIGPAADAPVCAVEQAVDAALGDALRAAEARLRARLAATSVADIARDFARRSTPRPTDAAGCGSAWPEPVA